MNLFAYLFGRRALRAEMEQALGRPDDPHNVGTFARAARIGDVGTRTAATEALLRLLPALAPETYRALPHSETARLYRFLDTDLRHVQLTATVIATIERTDDTAALRPLDRLIAHLGGRQPAEGQQIVDAACRCASILREHLAAAEETLLRSSFAPSIPEDSSRDHE